MISSPKKPSSAVTVELILGGLDPQLIAKQTTDIEQAARDQQFFATVQVEQFCSTYEADLRFRYCSKTGQKLGQSNMLHTAMAVEMYGEAKAFDYLLYDICSNPAPHWLKTDSEHLDKLMINDPRGYFVYACSYVLANHNPVEYETDKMGKFVWIMQKAYLFDKLADTNLDLIIRANQVMRQYLTVFEAKQITRYEKFDLLLSEDQAEILKAVGDDPQMFYNLLKKTLNTVVIDEHRKGKLSRNVDYYEMLVLKEKYVGHSSFRSQARPKGLTEQEQFNRSMEGFAIDANLPMDADKLQETNRRLLQLEDIDPNKTKSRSTTGTVNIKF